MDTLKLPQATVVALLNGDFGFWKKKDDVLVRRKTIDYERRLIIQDQDNNHWAFEYWMYGSGEGCSLYFTKKDIEFKRIYPKEKTIIVYEYEQEK